MTTFPDMVRQFGGVPVGVGGYAGFWGNKVYFVDYDNGTATADGTNIKHPAKYLETVLSNVSEWDTVYIRPRDPDTTGGDPQAITPASNAYNFYIPYTVHGVSLIGTGVGIPGVSAYQTRLQGHASTTSYPTLDVRSPFCNIENLGFRRGGSTAGNVWVKTDASTRYSFASTFSNCHFRLGYSSSAAGLVIDSAWYTKVHNCTFSSCKGGIYIGAGHSVPVEIVIAGCDFIGLTSEIDTDIASSGAVTRILIKDCYFNHAIPAGGSTNKYIAFGATSTGLVANCYTGATAGTLATNMTLNGVKNAGIWNVQTTVMA